MRQEKTTLSLNSIFKWLEFFCDIFYNHEKTSYVGIQGTRSSQAFKNNGNPEKFIYTRSCVPSFVQFSMCCGSYQYKFSTIRLCVNGKTLDLDHGLLTISCLIDKKNVENKWQQHQI